MSVGALLDSRLLDENGGFYICVVALVTGTHPQVAATQVKEKGIAPTAVTAAHQQSATPLGGATGLAPTPSAAVAVDEAQVNATGW